jgi:hypothetical protein
MKRPLLFFSCRTAGSYHQIIVGGSIPILHLRNPNSLLNVEKQDHIAVAHGIIMRYYKLKRRS